MGAVGGVREEGWCQGDVDSAVFAGRRELWLGMWRRGWRRGENVGSGGGTRAVSQSLFSELTSRQLSAVSQKVLFRLQVDR